jgi:hypothetical protein
MSGTKIGGIRVEGNYGMSDLLYINGRAVKVSHHFHEKFSMQDPVSGFVSSSSWSGVPFFRIRRSIDPKSIGPLPHLSEKEIPPIALTQPHFIPPLFL